MIFSNSFIINRFGESKSGFLLFFDNIRFFTTSFHFLSKPNQSKISTAFFLSIGFFQLINFHI